jgi:hypothetical protein
MTARRSRLLAAMLLCAMLIAGCGSGSSTTGTSTPAAAGTTSATAATASTTPAATATSTTIPTSTGPITSADVAAAVAECKSIAQKATISASLKSKVEGICNKAAHGNVAAAKAAAKEVCVEVIDATPVPEAEKAQALAACKAG